MEAELPPLNTPSKHNPSWLCLHTPPPPPRPPNPAGYPAQRSSQGGGGDPQGLPQQRLLAERKWRLGLAVRGHPSALMAELYRVLQAHGVAWKKLGPYNLKCRKVPVGGVDCGGGD